MTGMFIGAEYAIVCLASLRRSDRTDAAAVERNLNGFRVTLDMWRRIIYENKFIP